MKPNAELEELLHFLKDPSHYPHQPKEVEIIQTHASVLAMASPYVYKFKKPFDFGFMDFSTLEARRENAAKELRLNRRLCAHIYLDVIPLYRHKENLSFEEKGKVVDFALCMKEMEDGYFLHQQLVNGKLKKEQLDKILLVLKSFYESQEVKEEIKNFAKPDQLWQIVEENFVSLRKLPKGIFDSVILDWVDNEMKAFLLKNKKLINSRLEENRIKDCHGDLHLEHIHLQTEQVCIFDCIEFNDRYRYSDVAADIAFLAMDLDFNGYPDLGNYVGQRMADLLNDSGLSLLMDFYKSYRACVRAKVEGIRSLQAEVPASEKEASRQKVKGYLQLAFRYCLLGSQPWLLMVGGRIASGKSTLARRLASQTGVEFLSSDLFRKESAGLDPFIRPDGINRKLLYEEGKKREVYQELLRTALHLLHQERSVMVDATFGKKEFRSLFSNALKKHRLNYIFIEVLAPDYLIKERLLERESRQEVSDARLEDYEKLILAYENPQELPAQQHIDFRSEKATLEEEKKLLRSIISIKESVLPFTK